MASEHYNDGNWGRPGGHRRPDFTSCGVFIFAAYPQDDEAYASLGIIAASCGHDDVRGHRNVSHRVGQPGGQGVMWQWSQRLQLGEMFGVVVRALASGIGRPASTMLWSELLRGEAQALASSSSTNLTIKILAVDPRLRSTR